MENTANYTTNSPKARYKILIIEDNEMIQRLLTLILNKLGYSSILVAGNAYDALKLYEEGVDFIITDIGLPDVDGVTLCQTIRAMEAVSGKRTPIVVQTAYDVSEVPDDGTFNEVFNKLKFTKETIQAVLTKYLGVI
jgi:CheY-like chemotaxis protein